jgi:uncharacterized protein
MERRDFNLKIKSLDDAGTFVGLGAVYGNVDLGNDVIDPGAFSRTLSPGKSWPILWQHDAASPIGHCKITDTPQGLQVAGTLMLSDPTAQKAYTFMKAGVVKGLSIGYETIQSTYDGDIRHLTELRLWEISCVTFPMNESAQVSGVKALSDDERAKQLKGIHEDLMEIGRRHRSARKRLKTLFDVQDDDDTDDEPLIEGDDDDDDDDKAFLVELQKLAEQAEALTTT